MKTRVFYMSDLHLNHCWSINSETGFFSGNSFSMLPVTNTGADVLIIAGDTCNNLVKAFSFSKNSWYKEVCSRFRDVILVIGNHDFYGNCFTQLQEKVQRYILGQNIINLHVLDDSSWFDTITNTLFVGGTLFSDFDNQNPLSMYQASVSMSDYRYIRDKNYRKITPQDTLVKHLATVKYLRQTLQENKGVSTVVVTHHLPSFQLITEQYRGEALNGCYASTLDGLIIDNPQISHLICGHTHISNDLCIGDTRCLINPFGYSGENKQFDRDAHFIV